MGGIPKTAMNIVAYPIMKMDREILGEILAGGVEKLKEAETVLLGGHSVEDDEIKYGLSVTGFVHPEKILANQGLRLGDALILTKPLGVGIINTAVKGGLASKQTITKVTEIMATLNKDAATVMQSSPVSACTDVTGFGLLGHLAEMIAGTSMDITIDSGAVPILAEALEFAAMGFVPAGAHKNRTYRQQMVKTDADFDPILRDILYDPQTSGGLLIGVAERDAFSLLRRLQETGIEHAQIIGSVTDNKTEKITIR
jgi:selenide,water dikinase